MHLSIFRQSGFRFFISTDLESNFCAIFATKTNWIHDDKNIPPTYLGSYVDGIFIHAPNFEKVEWGMRRGAERLVQIIIRNHNSIVTELFQVKKAIRDRKIVELRNFGFSFRQIVDKIEGVSLGLVHRIWRQQS